MCYLILNIMRLAAATALSYYLVSYVKFSKLPE
jgi:hypothetical protein